MEKHWLLNHCKLIVAKFLSNCEKKHLEMVLISNLTSKTYINIYYYCVFLVFYKWHLSASFSDDNLRGDDAFD